MGNFKEAINELKNVETVGRKLHELTDEDFAQVSGGFLPGTPRPGPEPPVPPKPFLEPPVPPERAPLS